MPSFIRCIKNSYELFWDRDTVSVNAVSSFLSFVFAYSIGKILLISLFWTVKHYGGKETKLVSWSKYSYVCVRTAMKARGESSDVRLFATTSFHCGFTFWGTKYEAISLLNPWWWMKFPIRRVNLRQWSVYIQSTCALNVK